MPDQHGLAGAGCQISTEVAARLARAARRRARVWGELGSGELTRGLRSGPTTPRSAAKEVAAGRRRGPALNRATSSARRASSGPSSPARSAAGNPGDQAAGAPALWDGWRRGPGPMRRARRPSSTPTRAGAERPLAGARERTLVGPGIEASTQRGRTCGPGAPVAQHDQAVFRARSGAVRSRGAADAARDRCLRGRKRSSTADRLRTAFADRPLTLGGGARGAFRGSTIGIGTGPHRG